MLNCIQPFLHLFHFWKKPLLELVQDLINLLFFLFCVYIAYQSGLRGSHAVLVNHTHVLEIVRLAHLLVLVALVADILLWNVMS